MTRVYKDNALAPLLSFVGDETRQLGKAPTVQPALLLAFALLDATANVCQVLQDNRTAFRATLDNPLGQDVIAIPVEAHLLAAQFPEMAFRRPGSFGLQGTLQAKAALLNFFPAALAEEMAGRGDGGVIQPKVNAYHSLIPGSIGRRHIDDDMQAELALAVAQISSRRSSTQILLGIGGNDKGQDHPSASGRQIHLLLLPIDGVGVQIIAGRTERGTRRADLLAFGFEDQGAFDRFSRLDTSLNEQITDQTGARGFGLVVGQMMQPHAVLFFLLPTRCTDEIERRCKLAQGVQQHGMLLCRGLQLNPHRSVRVKNIPYMNEF